MANLHLNALDIVRLGKTVLGPIAEQPFAFGGAMLLAKIRQRFLTRQFIGIIKGQIQIRIVVG